MKRGNKLIFWNIITLILIVFVYIFGDFFSNYPLDRHNMEEALVHVAWDYLTYVIVSVLLISFFVALPLRQRKGLKITYLQTTFILNSAVLVCLVGLLGYLFVDDFIEVSILRDKYRKQAKEDIRNDSVTFQYAGLEVEPYNSDIRNKIDSICREYGIRSHNTGCMINDNDIVAQQTYDELVEPYLDKRNGADWRERMNEQIAEITKDLEEFPLKK